MIASPEWVVEPFSNSHVRDSFACGYELEQESACRSGLIGLELKDIDPRHIMDIDSGNYLMVGLPADF